MQNVAQGSSTDSQKLEKGNAHHDTGKSSTPQSSNSSPTKSGTDTFSELQPKFMSDSSESEEDDVSEVESFMIDQELEADSRLDTSKFLLSSSCAEETENSVDPETQARLEALLEAAGIGKLATGDGKHLADPEVLRRLTSSVSCALDEAAAALTRMRTENPRPQVETRSLVEACSDGDVKAVRKLLTEGRSVNETTEEGESLLSLACSAGYLELAQVLLAMNANVEDRGVKGDCTPLMEAASAGHPDLVKLLISHGAEVNAQSSSGNTPLMYACAGGHEDVVRVLLEHGANVEDHNENGHTPLMEAASAGHVGVAKILLKHGAGINTHSNEFKESALTLACYKGHLDMVRFLLEEGADQEHKTDEMHTALMEASMDGHVEVARLLLDSGAQVNMPTDSFESPLTLAACGGHTELAMLLIERGANIEEVNDEGYTPLMEAAREGHEEMVALLLSQGANINAQTEETQETALTLACCGGFFDVADFLLKAGADLELGASTPLMEAAQEGHLELCRYLLEYYHANVNAQTQTGDTALTYACENGHTEVATLLLAYGADLEHESEGGRTPLMKACRAGHQYTVSFLISKNADVNKQTTNNDHTPLSLAAAGGHIGIVELLLANHADPFHRLKDNSTMLIEAAKGGHTNVVHLLLDYPHSIMMQPPHPQPSTATVQDTVENPRVPIGDEEVQTLKSASVQGKVESTTNKQHNPQKSLNLLHKSRPSSTSEPGLTTAEVQQVRSQPIGDTMPPLIDPYSDSDYLIDILDKASEEGIQPNQFVERFGDRKNEATNVPTSTSSLKPLALNIDLSSQALTQGYILAGGKVVPVPYTAPPPLPPQPTTPPLPPQLPSTNSSPPQQPFEVSQNTAICDRPKAKPVSKKDGSKNVRKLFSLQQHQLELQQLKQEYQQVQTQAQTTQCPAQSLLQNQTIVTQVQEGRGITPTQLLAHLQQLDPAIATASPSQLQLLQKHQQLWTLQQQITPTSNVDVTELAGMLSDQSQRCQLFTQNNESESQVKGKCSSDSDALFIAAVAATQDAESSLKEDDFEVTGDQFDNIVLDFAHKLEAINFEDPPKGEQERLLLQARQQIATEEAIVAVEEEAFNLLSQQQSQQQTQSNNPQDLTYITVPAITSQQIQQRSDNQSLHIQYHQYAAIPPNLEVPALQITTTPLQIPGANGLQITGTGAQLQMPNPSRIDYYNAGYAAAAGLQNNSLQLGSNTSLSGLGSFSNGSLQTAQGLQVTTGSLPPIQIRAKPTRELLPSNRVQSGTVGGQYPPQLLLPSPISLPGCSLSTTDTSTTTTCTVTAECTSNKQVPVSRSYTQVQVATQTVAEKKIPSFAPVKGKKARYQIVPRQQNSNFTQQNNYPLDPNSGQYASSPTNSFPNTQCQQQQQHQPLQISSSMDVDSETDSNHDTALTLACAGGHEELVELLLSRGADIEHRDKKGFTPLILAATAGHEKVVDILLNHGADIEAQSERTKDTPLSLACSGGRYEVVELLLMKGANKEHRNVSDYTPLSLAASGGYVNIIKLLLNHGAEINSRTGSKLGISPLMLAAMNGHTAAVRLLLDMGSDINAQIETNRNTALTLACFQGRHEVVSLLLDRKAHVEHRAKTGLTPLMEAASGGYVDVGRVLLDKGADVNAPPVPSSRDTALTIAADKGHYKFVDLLLSRGALVEVKNKKGNSPLWLAANGGHLNVVEALYNLDADIDSQDNRKVSCLMAAFRKGHVKVVKWMVNHVTQFPSDQEMTRFITTINDKELLEKCQECVKIIRAAKDLQSAKANKNASILLQEIDKEKTREESKKAAAARRRERKKKKKMEKKEEKRKLYEENKKNERIDSEGEEDVQEKSDQEEEEEEEIPQKLVDSSKHMKTDVRLSSTSPVRNGEVVDKEEGDSGIDANSQGSCSSNDVKSKDNKRKEKKKKKGASAEKEKASSSKDTSPAATTPTTHETVASSIKSPESKDKITDNRKKEDSNMYNISSVVSNKSEITSQAFEPSKTNSRTFTSQNEKKSQRQASFVASEPAPSSRHPAEREDFEATGNENYVPASKGRKNNNSYMNHFENETVTTATTTGKGQNSTSPKGANKREEGWKEVVRNVPYRCKKVSVPPNAISRVIGRGGSNINAIRSATGAHIEVEKQGKGQVERIITIKGSADATKQAHNLIAVLIKDSEADITQMLPKSKSFEKSATTSSKSKGVTQKTSVTYSASSTSVPAAVTSKTIVTSISSVTLRAALYPKTVSSVAPKVAPRLVSDKRTSSGTNPTTKTTMSYTSAIMTSGRSVKLAPQTFAAKVTDNAPSLMISSSNLGVATKNRVNNTVMLGPPQAPATAPVSPQVSPPQQVMSSPKHHRPQQTASAPPNMQGQFPGKAPFPPPASSSSHPPPSGRSSTPIQPESGCHQPLEYSLFNDTFSKANMWVGRGENDTNQKLNFASVAATGALAPAPTSSNSKFMEDIQTQTQVDITKAPGYRGNTVCSPVSSKSSITPPSLTVIPGYSNNTSAVHFSEQPAPSLSVARPMEMNSNVGQMQVSQHIDVSSMNSNLGPGPIGPPSFVSRPSYQNMEMPRSATESQLYTPTSSYSQDMLNISGENQNQTQMMIPYQLSYNQQNSPPAAPAPPANQSVSMSRLNPRAPDFSVSYPKPPQQIFQQNNVPVTPMTIPTTVAYPPTKSYRQIPNNVPTNITANGQTRWSTGTTVIPTFPQPGLDMVGGFPSHAMLQSVDMLSFENGTGGNSPTMSPTSPTVNTQGDPKMEDRKIPRPIGTERNNWKNSTHLVYGSEEPSWRLNETKVNWPTGGMNPMYRAAQGQYRALTDDMLLESTYQQPTLTDMSFVNGPSTLTTQLMMAPQVPIQVAYDPNKIDQQAWDQSRLGINEGWSTSKWSQ